MSRWRIYCETEGAWIEGSGVSAPTTCYNDAGHAVTADSADRLKNVPATWTASDMKPTGTNGGTFTANAWQTRTLNTLSGANSADVTLNANQVTLQQGTYLIEAVAPAYDVAEHHVRWRNVTDGTDAIVGSPLNSNDTSNTSRLSGHVVVGASAKTFELQHRCLLTRETVGFGLASGFNVDEVYAVVTITKLSD